MVQIIHSPPSCICCGLSCCTLCAITAVPWLQTGCEAGWAAVQAEAARITNADRDARLQAAESKAAKATEDLRKAEAMRVQAEGELELKERCACCALVDAGSAGG